MDISLFKKLGLSEKEIKIYLALLEYGAISVRGLADITNLNRGTVYDILKKLQDKTLVTYFHQKTKQQFAAESPDRLLHLVEVKEQEMQNNKKRIKEILPELNSISDKGANTPVTKYYEGQKGVKTILQDVLDSQSAGDEYYVYSAKKASEDLNSAMPDFTKKRIKQRISVKAVSLAEGGSTSGLDERKWLGTQDDSATFIIIYADKCAFISRDARKRPVGVIIENQMIYETQKKVFLQLWQFLK